jgi:hypothetical protein
MSKPLFASDPQQRGDGLWIIGRQDFAQNYFDYKPGNHVVFGGPTTGGKTTLAFELLQYCATPDLPAYVAVSKPRDPTTESWGRKLGFRRVSEWPVPRTVKELMGEKPRGYLVWPKYGDLNLDVERSAKITRTLLMERYAAGARQKQAILIMDDTFVKSKILGLDREMTTILAMAAAMGIGMWVFVQKPTGAGNTALFSYGNAEHVFLASDPETRNQIRYDEIGGVDSRVVRDAMRTLQPYQFLYIKRTGRYICIVDKD